MKLLIFGLYALLLWDVRGMNEAAKTTRSGTDYHFSMDGDFDVYGSNQEEDNSSDAVGSAPPSNTANSSPEENVESGNNANQSNDFNNFYTSAGFFPNSNEDCLKNDEQLNVSHNTSPATKNRVGTDDNPPKDDKPFLNDREFKKWLSKAENFSESEYKPSKDSVGFVNVYLGKYENLFSNSIGHDDFEQKEHENYLEVMYSIFKSKDNLAEKNAGKSSILPFKTPSFHIPFIRRLSDFEKKQFSEGNDLFKIYKRSRSGELRGIEISFFIFKRSLSQMADLELYRSIDKENQMAMSPVRWGAKYILNGVTGKIAKVVQNPNSESIRAFKGIMTYVGQWISVNAKNKWRRGSAGWFEEHEARENSVQRFLREKKESSIKEDDFFSHFGIDLKMKLHETFQNWGVEQSKLHFIVFYGDSGTGKTSALSHLFSSGQFENDIAVVGVGNGDNLIGDENSPGALLLLLQKDSRWRCISFGGELYDNANSTFRALLDSLQMRNGGVFFKSPYLGSLVPVVNTIIVCTSNYEETGEENICKTKEDCVEFKKVRFGSFERDWLEKKIEDMYEEEFRERGLSGWKKIKNKWIGQKEINEAEAGSVLIGKFQQQIADGNLRETIAKNAVFNFTRELKHGSNKE